ncbi:hypothetical protein GW17_00053387 [Ensete ventricosum]|nr:hypothetical protein GW17_00053387 [Ensete ventricosum]
MRHDLSSRHRSSFSQKYALAPYPHYTVATAPAQTTTALARQQSPLRLASPLQALPYRQQGYPLAGALQPVAPAGVVLQATVAADGYRPYVLAVAGCARKRLLPLWATAYGLLPLRAGLGSI